MSLLIISSLLLACITQLTYCAGINQSILIQKYGFSIDSNEIDLSESSIDSIDINTFKGYNKLEKLYLHDNKLRQLEYGLFNNLTNLRELWLESNNIISIDRNVFAGMNKLEKVCLNDNPISLMFPNMIKPLCDSNPNCSIKINEKCIKETTTISNNLIEYI
jgi:Leucine-rich repeat (LRR) protein